MLNSVRNAVDNNWEVKGVARNKLIEKQGNKVISEVKIAPKGQYILYKFERNGVINLPYLSANKHVRKISDYVLLTEKGGTLFVLVFELKNGNGCPIPQLQATETLTKYLIETAQRVSRMSFGDIEYRRIGITNKSIKMNLRPGKIYNANRYVQLNCSYDIQINTLCE